MGSLMSGWDSPVSDPNLKKFMRNKSLTKEEIEAYWRKKKETEEEHLKAVSSPLSVSTQESTTVGSEMKFQRSSSLPMENSTKLSLIGMDKQTNLEEFIKKTAWWTRSKWAFLNEPPVLESNYKSYRSQFHVADLAAPKSGPNAEVSTY